MTTTRKKRPRDPLQLGKLIVDIATGQVEDREETGKDQTMSERGRAGGLKGGKARAAALTPNERASAAQKAAAARWKPKSA